MRTLARNRTWLHLFTPEKQKTYLKRTIVQKDETFVSFCRLFGGIDKAQKKQVLTKIITFRRRHNFGLVDKVITF